DLLRHHEEMALSSHRELRELADQLADRLASESAARAAAELAEQRAIEAARARDEFVSIASHELRGPASAVVMLGNDLLRHKESLEAPLVTRLEKLSKHVKRMVSLIDTLLDVARIRAGRLTPELHLEPVDLGALAQELIDEIADAIAQNSSVVHLH